MDESELRAKLKKYTFYHIIQLTPTVATPGNRYPNEAISQRALESIDLRGKRVLDVGCRDCKFSFLAERRGAAEVLGIDNDLSKAATEFLIPFFKSKVETREMNLLDLRPETYGRFDVVLFFGVLYHLRYPFWSLKVLRDMLEQNGLLVIETAVLLDANRYPLLYCPIGAESPYEDTSCTFFNEKGLRDTLRSLGLRVERVEHLSQGERVPGVKLLRRLSRGARAIARGKTLPMQVGRATFLCRFDSTLLDRDVANYWDRTHTLESPEKRDGAWIPSAGRVTSRNARS
jgi:SAM-dependent methyltransferase